jgi:hypothetical protein
MTKLENAGRDEKNGEKRKGKGSCGRGAKRRGRAVGEHQGLVLYFIAATLTWQSSSIPETVAPHAVRNLFENALYFSLVLQAHLPFQSLKTRQQGKPTVTVYVAETDLEVG